MFQKVHFWQFQLEAIKWWSVGRVVAPIQNDIFKPILKLKATLHFCRNLVGMYSLHGGQILSDTIATFERDVCHVLECTIWIKRYRFQPFLCSPIGPSHLIDGVNWHIYVWLHDAVVELKEIELRHYCRRRWPGWHSKLGIIFMNSLQNSLHCLSLSMHCWSKQSTLTTVCHRYATGDRKG